MIGHRADDLTGANRSFRSWGEEMSSNLSRRQVVPNAPVPNSPTRLRTKPMSGRVAGVRTFTLILATSPPPPHSTPSQIPGPVTLPASEISQA